MCEQKKCCGCCDLTVGIVILAVFSTIGLSGWSIYSIEAIINVMVNPLTMLIHFAVASGIAVMLLGIRTVFLWQGWCANSKSSS